MQGMGDLIKGPVGMVIGLVGWLVVFPMLLGAINGWYLQAAPAGVVAGERFDRVVLKGTNKPDVAWNGVAGLAASGAPAALDATEAYKLQAKNATDSTCVLGSLELYAVADPVKAYTPLGSEVTVKGNAAAAAAEISGCEYKPAGAIFGLGGLSGLIEIILQAAGLAPPIALLFVLGTFGTSFLKNSMGSHPILAAVLTAISFLLLATLLNTFIPYVSGAFNAIDSDRFLMYAEGLGALATVIGNFFGVVIVASIMSVAWQVIGSMKGGNALGGQKM